MPTFIDESGDTGWFDSPRQRSASHFRLAAVWLPSGEQADACRTAIRDLWRTIPLPASVEEFHYTDSGHRPDWRQAFYRTVLNYPFRFTLASFNKQAVWRDRPDRRLLFQACSVCLAATLRMHYALTEATLLPDRRNRKRLNEAVVVDNNADPVFMEEVHAAFLPLGTLNGGTRFLGPKPWFANSHQEELLQLADMVCGATCDHLAGNDEWFFPIRQRCLGISQIP